MDWESWAAVMPVFRFTSVLDGEQMQSIVSSCGTSHDSSHRADVAAAQGISARLAAHALTSGERIAVDDGTTQLTFAELYRRSTQIAARLLDAGVPAESCIGLFLDRSVDFVVAALAVLKAGAAYLPLDPATPMDRVRFILGDAGAPLALTHRGKSRELTNVPCQLLELDAVQYGSSSATVTRVSDHAAPALDRLAYVIYTSGSTGRPKGVEITHGNLLNLIDWHQAAFNVTAADRASQVAGLGFDAAVWEIWPHLTAGASVHFADEATRRSPALLRDWIVAQQITISFVPTLLAEQLLHSEWPANTPLRTLLTGADTLHRRPRPGLPFKLVNNYGPTECTVVATSGVVAAEGAGAATPSIGRPISDATALILDEQLHPVAPGQAGELCLAGSLVGRGYRNNAALTASQFVQVSLRQGESLRIYRTGDRAKLLQSGEIAFLGRLDDQVKLRGYRIELGEIVATLNRFLGVEASAVIVRDTGGAEPQLVAYIVAGADVRLSAVDLREFLATRLPDYMIPAIFVTIDMLPMTPNGKLDKAALPPPTANNILGGEKSATQVAPKPGLGLEGRISEMVAALLGQPTVARDVNFFMAGGHSMLGVQLVARIRDTFGVKLNLRQLFGAPTIAALSAEVEKMSAAGNGKVG
jgi:amino acid adenylation domain-containing protein